MKSSIHEMVQRKRGRDTMQLALLDQASNALRESVYDALVVQRMGVANNAVFEMRRVG